MFDWASPISLSLNLRGNTFKQSDDVGFQTIQNGFYFQINMHVEAKTQ